ncbi:PAP2 domain-containing protein [Coccidioides immitis RS]|uniref:Dolichyldiphosphatase n=1 Tax=Coccidioides immitis (strain RS) TaxID=246410 RepID=A0A0E1RV19_COCIM|nr:PAP2 domain-containing protein [Coccidioides immitis RS]EAS27578.2 PAP2 domain-containing protein [Coccidioides immitis RS]
MDNNKIDTPLASFSLTHVHYNPEDPLSYLCAFLSLVPQAIVVVYVALIWASREVEVLFMFAGQILCEALNFGLKRVIRQERPQRTLPQNLSLLRFLSIWKFISAPAKRQPSLEVYGKGYGMPSSHSQFVAFFAFSVALFLLVRHKPTSSSTLPNDSPSTLTERVILSLLAFSGAAAVASSRIYLNYHTPKQVMVGIAAGIAFSVVWYLFGTHLRRSGWIDWLLEVRMAKLLRMRDLLIGEDLAEAGWQRWKVKRGQSVVKKFE